mgnify:CR=1 FL=1
MRDGVRLASDIYHPKGVSKPPVLLYRTPYSKDETARLYGFASFLAGHGYTVVAQDCRGCFKSEGDVDFLRPEAEDGYDTLSWIAGQPWGDADVGSWGTSWSAWTQTAMASLGPARLKTIVPNMSGSDGWTSSIRHNGALELRLGHLRSAPDVLLSRLVVELVAGAADLFGVLVVGCCGGQWVNCHVVVVLSRDWPSSGELSGGVAGVGVVGVCWRR